MKTFTCILAMAAVAACSAFAADPDSPASDLAALKALIVQQQQQIDQLRQTLEEQSVLLKTLAARGSQPPANRSAEVASLTPVLPALPASVASAAPLALPDPRPLPEPQADSSLTARADSLQKAIDGINASLRGFRLSGDLRFRFDTQQRSANTAFGSSDNRSNAIQRARERYRVRVNVDKDLFYSDNSDRALAHFHLQLATDPFNNPSTMDTDFAGISTRAPISIAEAYMDFTPVKSLTLRAGRTPELFADGRQFVYDDDIRFNGFHETYRWNGNKAGLFIQAAAAQYILTEPNIQVLSASSPFLAAGYSAGQRVPSSNLFDQGVTVGSKIGKKWSHNETVNYFVVREPNQIQLASTAGGAALFANSPIVGANLISNLGETGNATTTPGGATYFASAFHVVRGAFNLNYSGTSFRGITTPSRSSSRPRTTPAPASPITDIWPAGAWARPRGWATYSSNISTSTNPRMASFRNSPTMTSEPAPASTSRATSFA